MSRSFGNTVKDMSFDRLHVRQHLTANHLRSNDMTTGVMIANDVQIDNDLSIGGGMQISGDLVATGAITASSGISMGLSDSNIYVGDASGTARNVPMSGDVSIDNTGATNIVAISNPLTAPIDMGTNAVTNLATPADPNDAATKAYVDGVTGGGGTLPDGLIYVGDALNVATPVTLSGDVSITNAGVATVVGFSAPITSSMDMNNNTVNNVGAPVVGTDATNKDYVDTVAAGLDPKDSSIAATTVAGTLATSFVAGTVIDGVTLALGDRLLIKDQFVQTENGVYIVTAGAPTRAADFDSGTLSNGAFSYVVSGSVNGLKSYVVTTADPITVGVSNIVFSEFGAGTTNLAIANVTASTLDVTSSSGTNATIPTATGSLAGLLSAADKTIIDAGPAPTNLATANVNTLTLDITSSTGSNATIPTATGSLAGLLSAADKTIIDAGPPATNLGVANINTVTLDVTSSTGSNVTIPTATITTAGLLSAADKVIVDAAASASTNLAVASVTATTLDITSSSGSDATIPAATGSLAGLLSAADKTIIDAGPPDTNLAVANVNTVTLDITSSTGTNATIPTATGSLAGLLSAADKTIIDAGPPPTNLAVANNNTVTLDITSSTGTDVTIPTATGSLAGLLSAADKTIIDAGPPDTNLAVANVNTVTLDITSSTGANATIPTATPSLAGLLSAADKTILDAGTDLAVANVGATTLDVTSSTGNNATIPAAVAGVTAGLLTAAGKTTLDNSISAANLATGTVNGTSYEITCSAGTNVVLPEAVAGGNAGLLSGADKTKLNGIATTETINGGNSTLDETVTTSVIDGIAVPGVFEGRTQTQAGNTAEAIRSMGMVIDSNDNLYAVGTYVNSGMVFMDTANPPATLSKDISAVSGVVTTYLVKYNSAKVLQWRTKIGSVSGTGLCRVCIDANNDVYVATTANGTTSFYGIEEPEPLTLSQDLSSASTRLCIAKYSSAGNLLWRNSIQSAAISPRQLTIDGTLLYMSCDYSGTANFFNASDVNESNSITKVGSGFFATLIAQYNATTGALNWRTHIAAVSGSRVEPSFAVSAAADSTGFYGHIWINGTVDFYNIASTPVALGASYQVSSINTVQTGLFYKYDTSGNLVWRSKVDAASGSSVHIKGLTLVGGTHIAICGTFTSSQNVDIYTSSLNSPLTIVSNTTMSVSGGSGGFVASLTTAGVFNWRTIIHHSVDTPIVEVARITSDGTNIYVGGAVDSEIEYYDIAPVPAVIGSSTTTTDGRALIAAYNTAGALQWRTQQGFVTPNSTNPRTFREGDIVVGSTEISIQQSWVGSASAQLEFYDTENPPSIIGSASAPINSTLSSGADGFISSYSNGLVFSSSMPTVATDGTTKFILANNNENSRVNITGLAGSLTRANLTSEGQTVTLMSGDSKWFVTSTTNGATVT